MVVLFQFVIQFAVGIGRCLIGIYVFLVCVLHSQWPEVSGYDEGEVDKAIEQLAPTMGGSMPEMNSFLFSLLRNTYSLQNWCRRLVGGWSSSSTLCVDESR